ncbi:MAG: hypothetical protein WBE74_02480 [Terracidiphilus sp.]
MDSDSEIRAAILGLVDAHDHLQASYRAIHHVLSEAAKKEPSLGLHWRDVAKREQVELERVAQDSAEIRTVLSSNEQFAHFLREYAALG